MAAPFLLPLLVIAGGAVALFASKKTASVSAANPALPAPRSGAGGAPGPLPPPFLPPSDGGGITLPGDPGGGPVIISGDGLAPWTSAMRVPSGLPSLPASYRAKSDETSAIQFALNGWIGSVGAPLAPLAVDGSYGPKTQAAAAAFQVWENATNPSASLAVDGLAGPMTQNFLLDFGPMTAGAY
jgi:hypothetical protein